MSNLHAYFALRNLQGFTKALDNTRGQTNMQPSGSTLSSSGGRSWTRINPFTSSAQHIDVNARDWLGRTILHVACASPEPFGLEYVRLLLAHPSINVNIQDAESRWTALHRALYVGNIAASQLLMQRPDIDVELRDSEGLTAFDLYNSTVQGTGINGVPSVRSVLTSGCGADLFTWGRNRNAALGHGDGEDRTYPDQVVIKSNIAPESTNDKLSPTQFRAVCMARLHTTVITTEKRGNLRACGFGSGGRLGPGQHTQYSLQPLPTFMHHVVAIALGQDHTLALTSDGEVLSWGLNRFSQLGYVVEPPMSSGSRAREEPIQAIARKVVGPLKKETVLGVAACKSASACWTRNDVYTWGTNNGQLGYDKASQPVQILPRKVTGVQDVSDLAMTDTAMACLLETKDVICFRDDGRFRIKFPTPELSDFSKYVHPFIIKPPIAKITSCDDTFAALSSRGEVFMFSVSSTPTESVSDRVERTAVKPQKVWSLRKSLDPARDIALGSDGEAVLCTESGHVFVRSRSGMGANGKTLKFHRVPFIHRTVRVCANSTGAFGALRLNYSPKPVSVSGPTLLDDLRSVRPWLNINEGLLSVHISHCEDTEDDERLEVDVAHTSRLCALLEAEKAMQRSADHGLFQGKGRLGHGADIVVQTGLDLPAHRAILAARSPVLQDLMGGSKTIVEDSTISIRYHFRAPKLPRILVTGCHPMTVLLLLEYVYSDDIPAVWDRRVKAELEIMARMLRLSALSEALSASVKHVPSPTIYTDMHNLFHGIPASLSAVKPDVFLELADRNVPCHSVILRARCPFFRNFFDDEDWTVNRWSSNGTISVDMKHFEWRAMSFALIWLYDGNEADLFEHLDSVESIPDLMDAVFAVMAVASELLLDKLMLICSAVILRYVTLNNVVSILGEATYYSALHLVDSLQDYSACNLEAIMEGRLLDDMHPDLIKSLSTFVQSRQADMSPVTRSNLIAKTALHRSSSWLELQDIPQPMVRGQWHAKESPKLGPSVADQSSIPRRTSVPAGSPLSSPALDATARQSPPRTPKPSQVDDIFVMDVPVDTLPTLDIGQPATPVNYSAPGQAWKSKSSHGPSKVDMKTIMAETATAAINTPRSVSGLPGASVARAEMSETTASISPRSFHKPSQRQRRRMDAHMPHFGPESTPQALSSTTSPRKLSEGQTSTAASHGPVSVRGSQSNTSVRATQASSSSPRVVSQAAKGQPATPMSVLQVSNSSFGPNSSVPDLVPKRPLDAPAWTTMTVKASPPPAQLSFAAIQQQQREQVQQPKGKRSLREIQEEEQAKQEEEDFLRWWTAEEQRLKAEAEAADTRLCQRRERRGHSGRRGTRTSRDNRGRGITP